MYGYSVHLWNVRKESQHYYKVYTVVQKKQYTQLLSISSPNIDRFSKFFQWYTQQEICNKDIIAVPPHLSGSAPRYLGALVPVSDQPGRRTLRSADASRLLVPPVKLSTVGSRAFPVAGSRVWNALLEEITSSSSWSSADALRLGCSGDRSQTSSSDLRLLYLLFCFILLTLR